MILVDTGYKQAAHWKMLSVLLFIMLACVNAAAIAADAKLGFFVTADGYFVTNHRTVNHLSSANIVIRDKFGTQFSAVVVASDVTNDLALLKTKGRFTAIPIAKSSAIEIGASVFASTPRINLSKGLGTGLIKAMVSSLTGLQGAPNVFGISMPPLSNGIGGTGGPLLTKDGNVIGVMTAPRQSKLVLAEHRKQAGDIVFAVKSDYLLALLATEKAAWRQLPPFNASIQRTHGQMAKDVGRAVGVVESVMASSVSMEHVPSSINMPTPAKSSPLESATSTVAGSENEIDASFRVGYKAWQQQDYEVAYHQLSEAAEQGHAKAQALLAGMYLNGQGVDSDALMASQWFRKAALHGDVTAGESLGLLFRDGIGVEPDDIEAVWWFRRAAKQGSPSAQAHLALMYEEGRGVSRDDAEALQWFEKAAQQGNPLAQYRLGIYYLEGRGVTKDEVLASKWLTESARQGFAQAQDYLRASATVH